MTRPVAVLRPEPGNAATAARVEALGLRATRMPLFAVRPVAWSLPDPSRFDALLLTSANAVRHAGRGLAELSHLPVLAVGAATARAATAAGLGVERIGSGGVAAILAESGRARPLHLCGVDHVDWGGPSVPVYTAEPVPVEDAGVLAGSVLLLHSVRAARRLAALVARDAVADLRVAAISEAVRVAGPDVPGLAVAQPDDRALVALAARLAAD